ncbi:hypothetical protein [Sinorhizobium sp. 22678]|uniref:hypothetical protein n=1 Tax=Sinorhizobium sp. 22678 TaxID=3453955 RepID=UPI003F83F820
MDTLASENENTPLSYDAFGSHATDPDGNLLRAVESVIEGFHKRAHIPKAYLRELQLCVDGRDFVFPRRKRNETADAIEPVIRAYQRRSRSLVVFCGPDSRDHPWINKEIEWWDEERPDGPVYFALTHGGDPSDREAIMPPALLARGGGDTPVFFDLRGYYRRQSPLRTLMAPWRIGDRERALRADARRWRSVRSFDEETMKLAARLVSDASGNAISIADLETAYAKGERAAKVRRHMIAGLAVAAFGGLAWFAVDALQSAVEERQHRTVATWTQQAEVLSASPGPQILDALIYSASAVHQSDNPEARRVLLRLIANLLPIDNSFIPAAGVERSGEQTQIAALFGDDRWLATGGRDGILHVADALTGRNNASIALETTRIRSIIPIEGGKMLAIGSDRGIRLVEFKVSNGSPSLKMIASALEKERIGGLALDADGALFAGTFIGDVWRVKVDQLWAGKKLPSGPFLQVVDPRPDRHGVAVGIFGLAVRGNRLIVAGIDGVLTIYDLARSPGTILSQIVHPNAIFGMDVTQDGNAIAIADDEGMVSVYNADLGPPRVARLRAPDPASTAAMPDGRWSAAKPDDVPVVAISFDPTGSIVGVAGHDRTVKFLLTDSLEPIGMLVHSAATRGVVFSPTSGAAFTFGDDGVVFATRPLSQNGEVRLGGVEGIVTARGNSIVGYWTEGNDNNSMVNGLLPGRFPPVERLGQSDPSAWDGLAVDQNVFAIRKVGSTRVDLFTFTRTAELPCGGKGLVHPNDVDDVQIVERLLPGTREGQLATVATILGTENSVVRLWNAQSCSSDWTLPYKGTSFLAATAAGAVAVAKKGKRIDLYEPEMSPPSVARTIEADKEVSALTVGPSAQRVAFRLGDVDTCLCVSDPNARHKGTTCPVRTTAYDCRRLETSGRFTARLEMSPSGNHLLLFSGSKIALASAERDWAVVPVAPQQTRPIGPPLAFSSDENLLAVPAGDTGIRVLDPRTLETKALLPTPSRVMRLAFLEDGSNRLISVDAKVMRIWDWSKASLIEKACRRWPEGTQAEHRTGVPPAATRREICGSP